VKSVAPPPSSAALAAELADLIERLTARVKAGEAVDLDELAAEHPAHADELRRIVPAMKLLADLSQSCVQFGERRGVSPTCADGGLSLAEPLGDFRLIREVGRGGMGVVYEAEQISLGRRVALKVLPFAGTLDPRQLQRFKNEAKAAASLRHEHIVHVYGVGCERGVHYYAMEYIEGQTLADVIRGRAGGVNPPVPETIAYREENRGVDTPRSPLAGTDHPARRPLDGAPRPPGPRVLPRGGAADRGRGQCPGTRPLPGHRPPRH
jgi:hypothetical protein